MQTALTILLIDPSPITSVRTMELLSNMEEVGNVFYAKDVKKGCAVFAISKVDLLILLDHLPKLKLSALTSLCVQFDCRVLVLSNYTHDSYKTWCEKNGVTYLLDKSSEINKIGDIIKNITEPMKD